MVGDGEHPGAEPVLVAAEPLQGRERPQHHVVGRAVRILDAGAAQVGIGTRSRSRTGFTNRRTSHSRSRATRSRARSGFTATGCPTFSSIGRSVTESE